MKDKNYYWIYSKHAIEAALFNPKRNIRAFILEKSLESYYLDLFSKNNNLRTKKKLIRVVNKDTIINKIGKLAKYQGVALQVKKLENLNICFLKKIEKNNNFILMIDKLSDPYNLGSILRSAYAFGIENIIVLDRYFPRENSLIASVASGALENVNIIQTKNIVNVIKFLKDKGWWIAGLESKNLKNCYNIKKKINFTKLALIIGSEGEGIRNLVRNNCDILLRIPIMENRVESINVVSATSIALYELSPYIKSIK